MANLYEINEVLMRLYEASVNEDGEIDEKALEAIEGLEMDKAAKIDNLACLIKNLNSDAAAIKAEADKLAKRAKSTEAKAKRLKEWLQMNLNGEKFSSPRNQIYWSSSSTLHYDEASIPKKYFVTTKVTELDKAAIKAAIADGKTVRGTWVESKPYIVIK